MATISAVLALLLFWIPMETRLEQRACIKMCVRAGDTFQETFRRLTASWGDHTLSITQVRFWFRRFQDDKDSSTKDKQHTGWPRSRRTTVKKRAVEGVVNQDRRQTVHQIAGQTGLSVTTAFCILKTELNFKKIAPKFMPKVLTDAQKQKRFDLANAHLVRINRNPGILTQIVATDKSWVYTFDPRTKQADMQWTLAHEPRPRKALRSCSQKKTLLILFFDSHGIISTYFLDGGTVDSDVYMDAVRQMREALRRKRPHL